MEKLIKLSISPKGPAIENFDDIVLKVSGTYSENHVTIEINPNITHYQENADRPGIKIRQVTKTTGERQTLNFDFKQNNIHKIKINNKPYEIKLMRIDKEEYDKQKFLFFEFFISN